MAFDGETLFIDGKWTAADGDARFDVSDPATGAVIGTASDAGAAEAGRAVEAAVQAAKSWSGENAYVRAAALWAAHHLMLERAEELARLMTSEQGKPLKAARNEVRYAADFLAWFAEEAKRVYGQTIPSNRDAHRFMVLKQPLGVVVGITPWNYPVSMITRKVAPAVAAGCTIVVKPAEQTPLCAAAVFKVFDDAGFPPGVANLVTTSRPEAVVGPLLDDARVRKLTFTGSTEVGTLLSVRAAATVKRVSLELGGHAPMIVFDDADPERAAKGASLVKFLNAGQTCISPNRIYVQRGILDDFLQVLTSRTERLQVGRGGDQPGVGVGPLIDPQALDKVQRQIDDAVARGAKVLTGGHRRVDDGLTDGYFFAPTVLADVDESMLIHREETFGPVAAVVGFDTEDEVIARANDTQYGLASYVYTGDVGRAIRVSEALKFGIVGVNDINPTGAQAPFGGMGVSGLGREGGAEGIDEYLDVKLIGISV